VGDEGVFITSRGSGLADEAGSDAIPDAAGNERGHRAAKPDTVVHRYIFNRRSLKHANVYGGSGGTGWSRARQQCVL
jgi:hypothetical protein